MAFIIDNITNIRGQDKSERVQGYWAYRTEDTRATILAADYFLNGATLVNSSGSLVASSTTQRFIDKFYEGDQISIERVESNGDFIEAFTVYVSAINKDTPSITVSILSESVEMVTVRIDDVSTADEVYIASPFEGTVTKVESTLQGAITGADAALTPKIDTVSMTGGGITIANSGSAAGDIDSSTPTAANEVEVGDVLSVETDGGSTNTVPVYVTFYITR